MTLVHQLSELCKVAAFKSFYGLDGPAVLIYCVVCAANTDRIGDRLAKILGVPEEYELVCILPVGIGEDVPAAPKKRPFEERARFNGFAPSAQGEA